MLSKLPVITVLDVSECGSACFSTPDIYLTVQHGSRNQHQFHTGIGKADYVRRAQETLPTSSTLGTRY